MKKIKENLALIIAVLVVSVAVLIIYSPLFQNKLENKKSLNKNSGFFY